jgi:hypothetical protein
MINSTSVNSIAFLDYPLFQILNMMKTFFEMKTFFGNKTFGVVSYVIVVGEIFIFPPQGLSFVRFLKQFLDTQVTQRYIIL